MSDQAPMCPHCGHPIRGLFGYEYRSKRELFGLPLVHIVSGSGIDPLAGRLRIAKGIIAIGGPALGGASFGVVSLGGAAVGLIAAGGASLGVLLALGGLAIGAVALGGNAQDPNLVEFFQNWFGRKGGGP